MALHSARLLSVAAIDELRHAHQRLAVGESEHLFEPKGSKYRPSFAPALKPTATRPGSLGGELVRPEYGTD